MSGRSSRLPVVSKETVGGMFAVYAGKKWGKHLMEVKDRLIQENPHLVRFLEVQIGKYPELLHNMLFEIAVGAITVLEHQALIDENSAIHTKSEHEKELIPEKPNKRGMGAMSKEQVHKITSLGGKTVHAMGKAHEWTKKEAKRAGGTGGKARKGSKWSRLK